MAAGAGCFYAYHFCGELTKTARAVHRCQFNRISPGSLALSASVPLRVRRVPLSFLLARFVDDVVPSSYSVPLPLAPS